MRKGTPLPCISVAPPRIARVLVTHTTLQQSCGCIFFSFAPNGNARGAVCSDFKAKNTRSRFQRPKYQGRVGFPGKYITVFARFNQSINERFIDSEGEGETQLSPPQKKTLQDGRKLGPRPSCWIKCGDKNIVYEPRRCGRREHHSTACKVAAVGDKHGVPRLQLSW